MGYISYQNYYINEVGFNTNFIEDSHITKEKYNKVLKQEMPKQFLKDNEEQEIENWKDSAICLLWEPFDDFKIKDWNDYSELSKKTNAILLRNMKNYYPNWAVINHKTTKIGDFRHVDMWKGRIGFYSQGKIPEAMKQITDDLNEVILDKNKSVLDKFKAIVLFHLNFERIHPFPEGNGRTGRLLMDKQLFVIGLPSINYDIESGYLTYMGEVQDDLTYKQGQNTLFKEIPDLFWKYTIEKYKNELKSLYELNLLNDFDKYTELLDELGK